MNGGWDFEEANETRGKVAGDGYPNSSVYVYVVYVVFLNSQILLESTRVLLYHRYTSLWICLSVF